MKKIITIVLSAFTLNSAAFVGSLRPTDENSISSSETIGAMRRVSATTIQGEDKTSLINNPSFSDNNADGWSGSTPQFQSYGNAEFFNTSFDFYQSLSGLKNGVYRVCVKGFYRAGSQEAAANSFHNIGETYNLYANLYATTAVGTRMTPLQSICTGETVTSLGDGTSDNGFGNVPNNMESANLYCNEGYYQENVVYCQVTDGNLTIGIKKVSTIEWDWTLFDDWQLYYLGEDAELPEDLNTIHMKDWVTESSVPVTFVNDVNNPWGVEGNQAIIHGIDKSNYYAASWLTMTYNSTKMTELSFEWARYNYNNHAELQLYIDGVYKSNTGSSSFSTQRYMLDAGEHVIAFRDSVSYRNYTGNWSAIKNVKIREVVPIEEVVLTPNSQPLTFTNDGQDPWIAANGYVEHGNWSVQNVGASFSTHFVVEETSKFSFSRRVANLNYNDSYNYESSHNLFTYVNGIQVTKDWNNTNFDYWCVVLEPGEYTVEWKDIVYTDYADWINYISQIKDIELSSNWITCELASVGTLGVEALYQVNVLNDIEMLKVVGPMNSSDWTDIKNMINLKALDLSEAILTEIPDNAFDGKGWLNSVILPEGIRRIGSYAFQGTNIRRINIPSTVTTIGRNAFISTPLQYLTFANGSQLTSIEKYAFKSCSSLQEVVLPEKVTSIGYGAFDLCSSVKKVEMPNTVTFLGAYAFASCRNMKSIHFSDALTEIPEWACLYANSLEDVHLPVGLTRINYEAFRDNTSLRHIDIPNTVNTIVCSAFYNCALDSVKLPTRLQYLGTEAFSHCNNLKYIELPSYIERGSYSYIYYYWNDGSNQGWTDDNSGYRSNFTYCPSIETIVMRSAAPPVNDADAFANSRAKSEITLKVPPFAVVNYKLDSYWYQFGSIVEGDDVDYWRIASALSLTNNRRMNGKPDIDLYYGGQFTIGGNAPMEVGQLNFYVSEGNPCRLLNTCEAMTADDINTYYSVSSETWYFFTPLHDVDLANVKVSNNASYVFRYYDGASRAANGTGNSWRNVDNGKLIAGQGYIFRCNANAVLTMPAGLGLTYNPIAPMTDKEAWEARVCYTTQSNSNWTQPAFDDSSWETQQAAWGTADNYTNVRNEWTIDNSDIYIRRKVTLTANELAKDLWIQFSHDDGLELYINGMPVINTGNTWKRDESHRLSSSEKQYLHAGENVIAAHCHNNEVPAFVDLGLYEKTFVGGVSGYNKVLNTSDATTTLTAYEAAASANKSWNYVGNPYPCYYDIYYMDFTAPITVWTGSTYKAYSIVDDEFALRPMQSFFVQKPDAVDNIIFHKEGRQLTSDINHAAAGAKMREATTSEKRYFFNLQMMNDEQTDETRVVLNSRASLDYELECDAAKFMSYETAVPQIYTLDAKGNGYAINERPMDNGLVALAYYAGQSGHYTITATRADGEIYLEDHLLNKTVNLTEQDYMFFSDKTEGINDSRFTLSLNVPDLTGIDAVKAAPTMSDAPIYDLQGRKMLPSSLKKGVYIQNGKKIFIR